MWGLCLAHSHHWRTIVGAARRHQESVEPRRRCQLSIVSFCCRKDAKRVPLIT
jgi:hypothetical protein